MLRTPRALDRSLLDGGTVVTDASNPVAFDIARMQMGYRRTVVETLPAAFLMN
jgi:hypothetical protein